MSEGREEIEGEKGHDHEDDRLVMA